MNIEFNYDSKQGKNRTRLVFKIVKMKSSVISIENLDTRNTGFYSKMKNKKYNLQIILNAISRYSGEDSEGGMIIYVEI